MDRKSMTCAKRIFSIMCVYSVLRTVLGLLLLFKYPKLVREEVSISVIQSREHILNTYNEAISKYAEVCRLIASVNGTNMTFPQDRFRRDDVHVLTNARFVVLFFVLKQTY